MKNLILIFLLIISIHAFSQNKFKDKDLTELSLKGKVYSVERVEYTLYPTKNLSDENITMYEKSIFNENGNYSHITRKHPQVDSGKETFQFNYNQSGHLVSKNIVFYDFSKSLVEYTYQSDKLTKAIDITENNPETHISYVYDKNGNITEIREDYQYVDEVITKMYNLTLYTYDSKKRLISETFYYNLEAGQKPESFENKIEFKYNEKGQISFKKEIYNSLDFREHQFQYNEDGYIIKEFENYNNESEDIYTYNYEYDQYGNWTKQSQNQNDEIMRVTTREITYF